MKTSQFDALVKASSKSYHQQKNFIKNVLNGKVQQCPTCQQTLTIVLDNSTGSNGIYCIKKCTDISLEL